MTTLLFDTPCTLIAHNIFQSQPKLFNIGLLDIKSFTLFYRENCHLCESMRLALVALQKEIEFEWVESDIDRDKDLIRLYDTLVPVLQYDGNEICHYFIDEKAIRELVLNR